MYCIIGDRRIEDYPRDPERPLCRRCTEKYGR